MKEIILGATDIIGGAEELAKWYKDPAFPERKDIFWRDIAPRVLPKVIEGNPDKPLFPVRITEEFVDSPSGPMLEARVVDDEFVDMPPQGEEED